MDDHNHKALIASIVQQACNDACSLDPLANQESAHEFLQTDNDIFCCYCYWLDIDPEWAVSFLHKKIIEVEKYLLVKVMLDREKFYRGLFRYPRKLYRDMMRRYGTRRRAYHRYLKVVLLNKDFIATQIRWPLMKIFIGQEVF